MRYVAQEDPDGCLVACVAMVAGRTYREIRELVAPAYRQGIHQIIANDVLGDLGFAIVTRYQHRPYLKAERDPWPCAPFAPAHIVYLHATMGPHAVVLDAVGRVYDPWKADRLTLADPAYTQIDHIDGIFAVPVGRSG